MPPGPCIQDRERRIISRSRLGEPPGILLRGRRLCRQLSCPVVSFVDAMTPSSFILRSLRYYWRTNLAVIVGVAIAVSVLAGALLVGDSVRGSLRDLFLGRLGRASLVLSASHFFPEDLSDRIEQQPDFQRRFKGVCPVIVIQGVVTH